jgi:hypothetical protein
MLLLFAAGIHAWLLGHTEVAARDSIGFIRYAIELERLPWPEVMRHSQQHPGYPVLLMVVSWPVRYAFGTDCDTLRFSAQLASSLASVLLVIPMFYLGRELFDQRAGFWGAVLFQGLPLTARILSDALSESLFLLILTTGLLLAVRAVRGRSPGLFALCGMCGGLAYLTRPEGLLLVVAAGLVLLGVQLVSAWRWPWSRTLACAATLGLTALVVGAPFPLIIGKLTAKPNPSKVMEELVSRPPLDEEVGRSRPLEASILAVYAPPNLKDRTWWALRAVGEETVRGFHYVLWLPALLGLWWFRRLFFKRPAVWVVAVYCFLHTLLLWKLAMVMGYVADRHVQVLVLGGVFAAAAGAWEAGLRLSALMARRWRGAARFNGRWLSAAFLAALATFGLPEVFRPLHANRAGHHAAGLWLAEHSRPYDQIMDPFCWAHYYTGRVFWEGLEPDPIPGPNPTCYIVLDRPDHEHSRLPVLEPAEQLAASGRLVYYWPDDQPISEAKIRIFATAKR